MGPASAAVDPTVADALNRALADIGRAHGVVPARPKWTLLDAYFKRAGVDGMTDPFFLETLIASDLLPFERPFVVAHEWSHLAGIADEGEANFVGWLACARASPAAQYSGWLFLYRELVQAVADRDRPPVAARLAPGPRADLRRDSRTLSPARQPARVRRGLARVRLVSQGQSGRGGRGKLRRSRAARSRSPAAVGVGAAIAVRSGGSGGSGRSVSGGRRVGQVGQVGQVGRVRQVGRASRVVFRGLATSIVKCPASS